MKNLSELFKTRDKTFSFELFPPKTEAGEEKLHQTIKEMAKLKPDFISVTYGAGGGSRDKTFDIVDYVQKETDITGVAHLTCVCNTREELKNILDEIKQRHIHNVLALRGDPPKDNPDWKPGQDNFKYSSELCAFIREHYGNYFGIGVAGFPEGHLLSPDKDTDAKHLKLKIDAGADCVITQLFFDNKDYFEYVERLRKIGVQSRVIPGIIPVTDYQALLRFSQMCGATVTKEVHDIFKDIQDDKEETLKRGIEFAVKQCQELLDGGAPGLHFYTLNKLHPTDTIIKAVR